MTEEEPRREILWIYADGRTRADSCVRAILPAPILEQAEIDPVANTMRITKFHRTTFDHQEPMIYEEFTSELKPMKPKMAQELINRVKALRP